MTATGQADAAGAAAEAAGDAARALSLFLSAGRPGRALGVALAHFSALPKEAHERVVAALVAGAVFDRAGALLERMGDAARALDAYTRGNAWRAAVDLARKVRAPKRAKRAYRRWQGGRAKRAPEASVSEVARGH
jgi:intraflagellar transport protein 172